MTAGADLWFQARMWSRSGAAPKLAGRAIRDSDPAAYGLPPTPEVLALLGAGLEHLDPESGTGDPCIGRG